MIEPNIWTLRSPFVIYYQKKKKASPLVIIICVILKGLRKNKLYYWIVI